MVKQVNDTLHSKLKVLAKRLRVNRTVQLMESALVQIPTVVGWLRPVILLPASALTGLSSEQLEAILAHELAHIKRVDYLINMLQTVVEILGFYHPAVWWVSHKIRAERENCCDDLAVAISGDRVCYARALTSMEEIRAGRGQLVRSGGLAVAATGGNLLGRIRRLVGKDPAEKNRFSWVPAATVILLIIALAIPATITLTARAQGKPEGLAGAVIKGIRANRDKFECGYLAWSSKHINNRFADSDRPATELAGQYELWWDGKKIATKYVRDQVYKDPEGNFSVEEQQGGTSYDGGVLSWKPDFHSDNWFGPEVTRWRGLGSQDWLIQQDSKQASISRDWSVVDTNGIKLIRVMTRNMNETARDYGAYSVRDYDPSKGYGLVNEEWYNPNGSPRLKHTVKMLEVIPGGWFPVEVDFKSFTITDGRVYTHQHYALDIERCSFNDKSALPDRVFKGAVDKQLKYQQKLQKYLAMELRGISDVKEAAKADRVKRGAREAIEKFVAAAMAGDFEKAGKFAHPDRLPANQIADLNEMAKGQNLWIMAVVADDFDAIAVSSVILGDHERIGPLVFFLDREPQDGRDNWWVHDIDMETPDGAEAELKQFLEKHPEAEKIPSEKKTDVQVENDRLGESQQEKESSAESIPVPVLAKSPAPSAEDKAHVQIDCLIVEVYLDFKMDRETTIVAENILGGKIRLRDTEGDVLLRKAAGATAATKDKSDENKRVTQDQFKALVEMLTSRGYLRTLMNPTLEIVNGKTAIVKSTQHVPIDTMTMRSTESDYLETKTKYEDVTDSLEITPNILEDGNITLQVEATLVSQSTPQGKEQTPIITKRKLSTLVCVSPGESLIIGGLTEKDPAPGDNVKNSKKRTAEVLFILTPTIITPSADSQEKTDVRVKGTRSKDTALQQLSFGTAVEGVQCRLQADKRIWQAGEVPTFKTDVRNGGERRLQLPESPDYCLVQVDGRWFFITGYEPGKEVGLSTRVLDFLPGQQRTGIPLELSDKWETMLDSEVARGAYVRHDGIITGPGLRSRLKLTPGKHTIRVSFIVTATGTRVGINPHALLQVVSNPVEIEILSAKKTEVRDKAKSAESAEKLKDLGKALLIYANDHDDKYPDSLHHLSEYLNVEELKWVLANIKYLTYGKTIAVRPDTVIAYDKTLLAERKGTNVLYNDFHVDFVKPERLKELDIGATAILIETRLLSVSEEFLKDIGLDANSVSNSDAWSEHLVADSAADPNTGTYSLLLDELHVSFLLRAAQAHKGTKALTAPRATVHEGKTAEIKIMTVYPVLDYNEPNDASDEPQPKTDYVEIGTRIWLKPELTPDNKNVNLDFKLEMSQLKGIIEGKYQGKYPYHKPIVDVISTETRTVVPNGKTLLIGGLKIIEQVESRSSVPILSKLPLIGKAFRSRSIIKDHKMLLILVKLIINPQQKASKILRGQADSEKHIKSLGRLLEKKLNRLAEPK